MACWFLIAGFLLLLVGSEMVMRGGIGLAQASGMSPLLIGLVVISAASSSPELFVALRAAMTDAPDIALGGIVGGCILNLLLVLGLGAIIRPMSSPPKVVLRDGGAMLLASLAVIAITWSGFVTRTSGGFLLAAFALYLAVTFLSDWRRSSEHSVVLARAGARMRSEPLPGVGALFLLLVGGVGLALGANFSVAGSIAVAREFHLQEAFVGLTIIAFGVSLPKLLTTMVWAVRGNVNLAVGSLIGANVFDLLAVLGVTALVSPLVVSPLLASTDVYVLAGASAALLPLLAMRWRLSRPRGVMLIVAYACYLIFLAWRQGLVSSQMFGI
ncbi:MAG: sodium:calcium antiporter [Alphaproteobacteria bacterium]|nr:sodium:calcium antiporter [Alphaproteobacteria bacterium]MDE2495047.1 sodium:calcium antiporter [Alphaproteobacteria bacterium]